MPENPLTTSQVAARFGVTNDTVRQWADAGLITYLRTPGGQRRFPVDEVDRLAAEIRGARESAS